jgi:hypothetical protein
VIFRIEKESGDSVDPSMMRDKSRNQSTIVKKMVKTIGRNIHKKIDAGGREKTQHEY